MYDGWNFQVKTKKSCDLELNLSKYHQQIYNEFSDKQIHILIVDDTVYNIIGLRQLFLPLKNFVCESAMNGQEAINSIKVRIANIKNKILAPYKMFRFIFMDINMPIMDGL